jgi:hypothetical protein
MTKPLHTLDLDDDTAFLRGIENANAETVGAFIAAIMRAREVNTYSNQDLDKRMDIRAHLRVLRAVGKTPIAR